MPTFWQYIYENEHQDIIKVEHNSYEKAKA